MEKYIFVKSDECRDYYPENKPYDFKIHLDNALDRSTRLLENWYNRVFYSVFNEKDSH